jgi:DNA-binding SARP family transcriptional activator/tetratricopeptide (TPR) repeat protein
MRPLTTAAPRDVADKIDAMPAAGPPRPPLALQLAGAPQAVANDGHAWPLAALDAAILVWLALEGPTARVRIAALLWPEKEAAVARNSLRQRLFQLHKRLGRELVAGAATLSLAAGVTHDLDDADTLLDGVPIEIGGEFAQWLALQRGRRAGRVRRSLVELAEMAEAAKDYDDALVHAGELLAMEPLSEETHRRVMRLHYLRGDRAAALLAFDRCERVLKDEVGAQPSAETLALLATIEASKRADALQPDGPVPASVLRPPRLVGRDRELAQLAQGWHAGQVVALIGEAGIGKTRLLHEFAGARPGVVHVAGRPGDAGVPFATLARLLRAVTALDGAATSLVPAPARHELARVLPELDAAALPHQAGEGRGLVLQRALVELLVARRGPLAGLIVDDLHFADEASLEMLGALVDDERGRGLHWAFAYRSAEAGSPVQALRDGLVEQARLVPVALLPLDEVGLAELVDSLALPGIDGRSLAPGLLQRTGGNPLFVLETLKQAWVERSLAELADARRLPRPVSVGRLIERRLAQLSPGALALARVASIAGVDFSIELAEAVLQAGALQFADAINELEAAQVLRGSAFAHDLVFDAVRASVPQAVAQLSHARVAAWLEPRGGEPARVAAHWTAAGREVQALPWLALAAERAGAALRRREQVDFLDRKSRIEEGSGDRAAAFDTLMRAAEIEATLDDAAGADGSLCDRLDALADGVERRVRAATQRSNLVTMRGFLAEAERIAAQALREALREGVAEAAQAQCRIALGTALSGQGKATEALVHFEAALGWVRAQPDDDLRCEFHGNLATTYDREGRFDDGAAQHRETIRIARKLDDYTNQIIGLSNAAANRALCGRMAEAERLLEQAGRLYAQAAEPSAIGGYLAIEDAVLHRQLGRYGRALRCIDDGIVQLRRYAPGYVPVLLGHRASCWAHLGQWARMEQTLAEVEAHPIATHRVVRVALLRHAADLALRRAARPQALEEALAKLAGSASRDIRHALQIELATLGGDLAALDRVADEAGGLGHAMSRMAALARAASVALTLGREEAAVVRAREAWALSYEVVATMFYPLDPWWYCARVFEATGAAAAAAEVARRSKEWIEAALAGEVAAEFRDSFLHRNPVNRELLGLASRIRIL